MSYTNTLTSFSGGEPIDMPTVLGPINWSMTRDADGNREYKITFKLRADSTGDGPKVLLDTPGLPQPGDSWNYFNDYDLNATCTQQVDINPEVGTEKNLFWSAQYTFSTKNKNRCQDEKVEDPLQEPAKVSGGFIKDKEEATRDRFGRPLMTSSWEQLRGPQVEFDKSRPKISIEQNVLTFYQAYILPQLMADHVNSKPLWGMPRRTIKLSDSSFERKYHGKCFKYYTRKLEFEGNALTFDRDILDEGTKVLRGRWDNSTPGGTWVLKKIGGENPNPYNPQHFDRFKDRNGENCRVILNGAGLPAGVVASTDDTYVSAPKFGVIDNQGNLLSNSDYWVQPFDYVTDGKANEWVIDQKYSRGNVVIVEGVLYIAVEEITRAFDRQLNPALAWNSGDESSKWRRLNQPVDKGLYNQATNYTRGDYVHPATATTAGVRHVEYYREADFLALGIPAQL